MITKKLCKHCRKIILPRKMEIYPRRNYCNYNCRNSYNSSITRERLRFDETFKKINRNRFRQWYLRNKDKQKKLILRYYRLNKKEWRERGWVGRHRKEILSVIPNVCKECGDNNIKIIHHISYDSPRPKLGNHEKDCRNNIKLIKEYSEKNLLLFCSNKCHRLYEQKIKYIS